jgi:predicted CopG family antitoxin
MASSSVSVRVSDEVLEELTKRANAENKKVSDLVRELIEAGLKPGGNTDNSSVLARVDALEETIRALLGAEDASVMTRIDAVNADFWQAHTALSSYLIKAIEAGAEARYFARLAAMYGLDIAHYVAQKTEVGVTPNPLDKDEKSKQLGFYERKCKEYAADLLNRDV